MRSNLGSQSPIRVLSQPLVLRKLGRISNPPVFARFAILFSILFDELMNNIVPLTWPTKK